ncbi:hypothetical protein V1264_020883 [Littorina saxatilis]
MIEQAQESLKQKGVGNTSIVSELEIQNYLAQETGKDRLFKMFTRDHIGKSSSEFAFTYQVTLQAAGLTFLMMSFLAGRQAKQEFIDRNRATVFKTRFQAFRRLNDQIFLFSMKEGMKWAMRVSLFSLSFMGISQSIAVYRNKSSPWEYAIASGTTIGALKANMGLRGFVVATGFGLVIGTFMGVVVLGAMKALNETQEQRHYWEIQKELEKEKYYESRGKLEAVTGL